MVWFAVCDCGISWPPPDLSPEQSLLVFTVYDCGLKSPQNIRPLYSLDTTPMACIRGSCAYTISASQDHVLAPTLINLLMGLIAAYKRGLIIVFSKHTRVVCIGSYYYKYYGVLCNLAFIIGLLS